tara:strand:+ start:45 stop:440 length:396 start_codon:yes stop_codon:yes gene_type:complete
MVKTAFNKEETRNLLNMLQSPDEENHIIVFEALKNADLSNYFGELMVLYKFSKLGSDKWTKNCKKVYSLIEEHTNGKTLTSANCLGIMTNARSTKESIELFMEYFVRDMTGFLGQMGYPTEKFEIEIKLKD